MPVTITAHKNVDKGWLCSMYFGGGRLGGQNCLLTRGSTKGHAVQKMRQYAERLEVPFPERVPTT